MHTSLTYNEGSRCVSLLVTSVVTLSKVIVVWATISRHMANLCFSLGAHMESFRF